MKTHKIIPTMEKTLSHLQPQHVWEHFEDICQVPRPSKKEDQIIEFLLEFGKKHNLETKRDEIGNVLICKPATPGMENRKNCCVAVTHGYGLRKEHGNKA